MAYAFGAGDFNFSGVDMDDTLAGVTLVMLPANGTLTLDGTAVTADQTVTRVDINAGKLRYTPPANANGPGYASFTFKVRGSTLVSDDAYAMTINVTAVNDAATGTPVIFGDAVVDRTLTAGKGDIADLDALPATFPDGYTFQWVRVDADGMSNPADIGGATSGVYTLTAEDVGKRVKVRVSVTDEAGTRELRESEPTAEVAATDNNDTTAPRVVSIVRQSPTASPTNADSLTWRVAFSEPVQDMDAADFTVSGTTALPTSVTAVPGSPSQHDVTVAGGDLQNAETTALLAFADGHGIADTAGNSLVNTAPTWTNDNTFVMDNTAPTLNSGSVAGASVTLTFSEALDAGSVPGADAFEATVAGSPAALAGTGAVALDGRVVTLTLASPALMRRAVSLTYTPPTGPSATPLRDVAGNGVELIERRTIPNVTPHGPPANLMARVGDRTVRLVWEKPAGEDAPDIGYEFRYAAAPSVPTETGWIRGNRAGVTTVQALGLANGTSYAFEVRAVDTDGAGAPAAVAATPAPAVCNAPNLGATRRQIWSGMVEVGSLYYYATQGTDHGFDETWAGFGNDNILRQFGRLTSSDRDFSIGDHSDTVIGIVSVTNGDGRPGSLFLRVRKTLPEAVKSVLSLHWCDQSSGVFLYTSVYSPAIDFRYIATDRGETDFSLYRTLAVALSLPPNNAATGTPEVSGTASVGETLTAAIGDIADADGLPTTFPDDYTFQWLRVDADGASNPVEIADATASAYTLTDDDVGKRVKARISFSDQLDGAEVRESALTATVTVSAVDAAPTVTSIERQTPASSPTNADTLTWRVTFSEAVENVDAADFTVTGATATLTVMAVTGETGVYDVTAAGAALASLDATVTLAFATDQNIADGAANALADTAPTGRNDNTFTLDNTAPTFVSGTANGVTLVLTFSEELDPSSEPPGEAFDVSTLAFIPVVGSVALDGATVTLTVAPAVIAYQTVTVANNAWMGAGFPPLRDAAGNEVAPAVDAGNYSLTNETPLGPPASLRAEAGDGRVRLVWTDRRALRQISSATRSAMPRAPRCRRPRPGPEQAMSKF